jgi:excisionase family DNA binding protein
MSVEENWLKVAETAVLLRQTETTVRRKIRDGRLPAFRLGSSPRAPFRVPVQAVAAHLRAERPNLDVAAHGRVATARQRPPAGASEAA